MHGDWGKLMNKDQHRILGDFYYIAQIGFSCRPTGFQWGVPAPQHYRGIKDKSSGDHDPIFRGTKTKTPQLCLAAVLDQLRNIGRDPGYVRDSLKTQNFP